jgi:myo-inositol 2-dehydrogenase/D-chiro-inositol 1-dehydrogenase
MADGGNFVIKGKNPFSRNGRGINAWQEEHYPFYDAVRNNKPYNELEYGAHSTMTAIMGRMATYSGRIIDWDKALNSTVNLGPDTYSWDAKPKPAVGPDGLYPMPMPGDPEWFKKII